MSKLPSFLNYNRSISPSEAFMYAIIGNELAPVEVVERTVRGAMSNYKSEHVEKKEIKKTADKEHNIEAPNPQKIDVAFIPPEASGLSVKFSVVFDAASIAPTSCNDQEVRETLAEVATAYREKGGYHFLAKRYLWNIVNARTLWRNRIATEKKVVVTFGEEKFTFDADAIPTDRYPGDDYFSAEFHTIAKAIGDSLSGQSAPLFLEVDVRGTMAPGTEVYPSQEFASKEDKDRDGRTKSRVLSSVPRQGLNQATIHSQKIGNALRTIDEWHPQIDTYGAIPAEVYGYLHSHQVAVRAKGVTNLYQLLKKADKLKSVIEKAADIEDPLMDDVHYFFATLIRGGVFSKTKNG